MSFFFNFSWLFCLHKILYTIHIFDFEILNGLVEISKPLNYSLKLPVNDEYQNIKIDETTLHEKISIAEVKN